MNILILTSFESIGNGVGSKRPYIFAQCLEERGHNVVVVSAGLKELQKKAPIIPPIEEKKKWMPSWLRSIGYRKMILKRSAKDALSSRKRYLLMVDRINQIDKNAKFDVVFSTYGQLECLFAGKYASDKFQCKWAMDFRDPLVQWNYRPYAWNIIMTIVSQFILPYADLITSVSSNYSRGIALSSWVSVETLYNGYVERKITHNDQSTGNPHIFKICYTGRVYQRDRDDAAFQTFVELLSLLFQKGVCSPSNTKFVCAGPNSDVLCRILINNGLSEIIDYRGIVTYEESKIIQEESDLFLVLDWNTKEENGILRAKLYESIACRKPVLALVHGNEPYSELWELNEQYKYGFCFEDSHRKEQFQALCDFFSNLYKQKINIGKVTYSPSESFRHDFEYHHLAKCLEKKMMNICYPEQYNQREHVLIVDRKYPTYKNPYQHPFVHRRNVAYHSQGLSSEMICVNPSTAGSYTRSFEKCEVRECNDSWLKDLLSSVQGRTVVCVHLMGPYIWNILKDFLPQIRLIIWCHGSDIQKLERLKVGVDWRKRSVRKAFEQRDKMWEEVFKASCNYDISFVFVSNYLKELTLEDYSISLPNSYVIHNYIDEDLFSYTPKSPEQRYRILAIKSFNSAIYANDIMQEAIVLLSTEPEFREMVFDIYGQGKMFEQDTKKLRQYANVHLHNHSLTQKQIASIHKTYGIFLAATRMDTQGVSRDEAMASGLVPVTCRVAAVPEFVDNDCGILVQPENPRAFADGILALVKNPELFLRLSANAAKHVREISGLDQTIYKELELIQKQ